MRILDINNNYSPTGGGVRTYHHKKQAYYRETSHEVRLVVPSDRYERTVNNEGDIFYHVPGIALGKSGYRQILHGRYLKKVLLDFSPDIIEIGSAYTLPFILHRLVKNRIPTVGFYHADYPDTYVVPLLQNFFGKNPFFSPLISFGTKLAHQHMGHTYRSMTATFGASSFVLKKLSSQRVDRLFHTPLGVDLVRFEPKNRSEKWRIAHKIGPDDVMILFLARLAPEKGLQRLIEAYPSFISSKIKLVIAGSGPMEKKIQILSERHPSIQLLGYISDPKQLSMLYATADIFLSLGTHETFSLSTLEALASGTPVIAPSSGGAGELLQRLALQGRFDPELPANSAAKNSMISAIRNMIVVKHDRNRLRKAVKQTFSWSKTFERHTKNYEKVIFAHQQGDLSLLEQTKTQKAAFQ